MRSWIGILAVLCAAGAQAAPKIAVTDMAFEQRVEQYIHTVSAQTTFKANAHSASSSDSYNEHKARNTYIEQGELRQFSGDIKGEIIKSGMFELVQGTPYKTTARDDVYDIIKRIKSGHFKGADYVLFGTLSNVDFRQEINPIANTNTRSLVLGLTLVGDFSLIDARTFQITSAFTAMGEAQDTKLVTGSAVSPNRGRVVRDVSKSIGLDVTRQLREQLHGQVEQSQQQPIPRNDMPADEAPKILR